jgi:peptidoglycan/LPS O-acetylase OafA/YrhL
MRPRLPHYPALDGVRGMAVIGVLLFHGGFGWMKGGFLGVSTFFTLSGFLIASLLLTEWGGNGRISLPAFWARRFRRLMPALLLTLLAIALFGAVVATAEQLNRLRADGLATLGYIANWRLMLSGQSYGELFAAPSPLLHAWSLAIEEQFYVCFPPMITGLLVVTRGSRRVVGFVFGGLAAVSALLMVALHHSGQDPSRVYYGTDTRATEILVGVALAALVSSRGLAQSKLLQRFIAAAGVGALALVVAYWALTAQTADWLYEGGFALYAVATVAIVAAAIHPGPVRALLSLRPLRWVGVVSYGAYLFHWPLFLWLTPARTGLSTAPLFAVRVAATFALAAASYKLLEQPIRAGRRLTGRQPLVAVPAAATVAALALIVVTIDPPAPNVLFASPRAAAEPAPPKLPPASSGGVTRVMVAGDSVALTVAFGMHDVANDLEVAVLNRGALGCGVAGGTGRVRLGDGRVVNETPECATWPVRWAVDAQAFKPDVVLLVLAAWDAGERQLGDRWTHPCERDFDARFRARVQRAVDVLASGGGPVVIATAPYLRSGVVVESKQEGDRRIDCMNRVFRDIVDDGSAVLLDLAKFVCPTRATCRDRVNGTVLRRDGVHYDGDGGKIVARWLVPRLVTLAEVDD